MANSRLRYVVIAVLIFAALSFSACTRSASTPPPEPEEGESSGAQSETQATMDAVRSAILTQTAMAEQGISGTYTPTPEVDETSGVEVTSTPSILLASATPTLSVEYVEYTVKPGDWIWQIARDFNVDPQAIIDANQLANPGAIEVGMVLKIPVGSAPPTATPVTSATPGTTGTPGSETPEGVTIHIVKPGEWIWQIARQYGVDPQAIIDANNLTSSMIYPGDELIIP